MDIAVDIHSNTSDTQSIKNITSIAAIVQNIVFLIVPQ